MENQQANETAKTCTIAPFSSSNELKDLFKALSSAQGQMLAAKADSENPYFKSKYADLKSCWDTIRKPLTDNGLSIIQLPTEGSMSVKIITVLAHNSGQWISNCVELKPTKNDPQGVGSAMTYARRYGLMAITGIAPEDDDGNDASKKVAEPPQRKSETTNQQSTEQNPVLSEKQLKRLWAIAKESTWDDADIKRYYSEVFNIESSKQLTLEMYNEICEYMPKYKNGGRG